MNLNLFTSFATIGCLLLASCYPVNEGPNDKTAANKTPDKTAAAAEARKLKDKEAAKEKEKEELAQKETPPEKTDGSTEKPPTEKTKGPGETKKETYPVAIRAPGKENCVLSPYNNKLVSTLDDNNKPIPPGTLVQDPSYSASEKKFFRVP